MKQLPTGILSHQLSVEVAIAQSAPRQLPPTSLQSNRPLRRSHRLTVSFNKPFSATKDFIKDLDETFEISVTLQSPKDLHWNTRHPFELLHLYLVSVSAWFNLINNDADGDLKEHHLQVRRNHL